MTLRGRLHRQLDPAARPGGGLSPLNRLVVALIVFSVGVAIVESEPLWFTGSERVFDFLEVALGLAFLAEYVARVWVAADSDRWGGSRLRYAVSPAALLDLIALSPLLLAAIGSEAYLLRLLRLLRVLRLAKLGRFSLALNAIRDALKSRRFELIASVSLALVLLLITSTLMYLVEGSAQPEAFGSIPRAMWWSVATLRRSDTATSFRPPLQERCWRG